MTTPLHSSSSAAPEAAPKKRRPYVLPLTLCIVAAVLLTLGIVPRLQGASALAAQVAAQSVTTVTVNIPQKAPATQELLLPASVTPYTDAAIYARTSGYIKSWTSDIGASVKQGQVLAVIEAPEVDAALAQAKADYNTAKANYLYSKSTADRWQELLKTQSVSVQDANTRTSDSEAKRAMMASAAANVDRTQELVSYETVRAPFAGTVTARNIDVGTLVSAAGASGAPANAAQLFHLQQIDALRIFADVPQHDAGYISDTTHVYLTSGQYPGKQFPAQITRNASSLDPTTRTLHVEVDVQNKPHQLLPGAYVQVHIALESQSPQLDVPVSAVLFRSSGPQVAVVDSHNKAQLRSVGLGRDFGTSIEITNGITAQDRVIDNPTDSMTSGQTVQIAASGA